MGAISILCLIVMLVISAFSNFLFEYNFSDKRSLFSFFFFVSDKWALYFWLDCYVIDRAVLCFLSECYFSDKRALCPFDCYVCDKRALFFV